MSLPGHESQSSSHVTDWGVTASKHCISKTLIQESWMHSYLSAGIMLKAVSFSSPEGSTKCATITSKKTLPLSSTSRSCFSVTHCNCVILIPLNSATFFIASSSSNELTTHIRLAAQLVRTCKPSTGNGERSNTAEIRILLRCKREMCLFRKHKGQQHNVPSRVHWHFVH